VVDEMIAVPCSIMRGGTSKAVFFLENDVPKASEARHSFLLAVFGSPDARQIDGLGGADPLTSKCAIVGFPSVPDADVDYSFYQIGIDSATVEPGLCGNISAAVGPFAIEKGLVRATDPITRIKIHNPHRNMIFSEDVKTREGKVLVEGRYKIDGVPGTGSKITLDWANINQTSGDILLPTGRTKQKIKVDGIGNITMSIVTFGNTCCFIKASEIGLTGTELPNEVDRDKDLLDKLEVLRIAGARAAGLIKDGTKYQAKNASDPLLVFISSPAAYVTYSGENIKSDNIDLVARTIFMQTMHKTYAASGALCTAVAARIEGTLVNEIKKKESRFKKTLTIGHPGGIMDVEAEVEKTGSKFFVKSAKFYRTVRKLMDGHVYIKKSALKG
jgi:2-methylaconitate cis-trans-isomerase PrpF